MVFEWGDDGRGRLITLLEEDGFPSPIFKPKIRRLQNGRWVEPAIPLQAADLLAFEFFDPVRKIETDGYLARIRPSYEALSRIPGSTRGIRAEDLIESLSLKTTKCGFHRRRMLTLLRYLGRSEVRTERVRQVHVSLGSYPSVDQVSGTLAYELSNFLL